MSQSAPRKSRTRKPETSALAEELRRVLVAPKHIDASFLSDAYSQVTPRTGVGDFPSQRLVWVGAVLRSPVRSATPHIEALLAPPASCDPSAMHVASLPIATLTALNAVRGQKKMPSRKPKPHWVRSDVPRLEKRAAPKQWTLYAWFGSPDTCIVTSGEIPTLEVAMPVTERCPAHAPFCVLFDRASHRVVIFPCWEIFRFYYAWSERVATSIFQFPRWGQQMPADLLAWFDGHRFRRGRVRKRWVRDDAGYALAQLRAIGLDASVSYVRTGRAEIRAVPPFVGPVRIMCAGMPVRFGGLKGLVVRRIFHSLPRCDGNRSLRWW